MAVSVKVTEKDSGWAALGQFAKGPTREVIIHVPAKDPKTHYPYPLALEHGTRTMAPRPFMQWTFDAHDNYRAAIRDLSKLIFVRVGQGVDFGERATAELRKFGEKVVEDVRETITGMGLIDTGRMYRSVRSNVVVGGIKEKP